MTDLATSPALPSYEPIPYRVDADEDVTCPHCQLKNDTDATYCDQCGTELAGRIDVTVAGAPFVADVDEGTDADGSSTVPLEPAPYAPEPYDPQVDETVQCPVCQKMNDPDARFCDQCGIVLVGREDVKTDGPAEEIDNINRSRDISRAIPDAVLIQCTVCMSDNDGDAQFCDQCGQPVPEDADDDGAEGTSSDPDAAEEDIDDDATRSRSFARTRSRAPKDGVLRRVEFRSVPSDDGLTLEGYAAVWNEQTLIDSWEGTFRERMMPGAFAKTLSERKPVMMFDHGKHPMVGSMPIGTITTLREDSTGLYVKARLSDNWLIQPVRDAIHDGAVDGMSMRMRVIKDKWTPGADRMPERSITEVDVRELGPVVFPQYDTTTVSVRSRETFTALSDPEVRADLARLFAMGTDLESAVATKDEPARSHSPRSAHIHRARVALAFEKEL